MSLTLLTGLRSTGRPRLEFRTTGGAAYCQAPTEDEFENGGLTCWTPRSGRLVTMKTGVTMRFHRQAIGARPSGFRTVGFGASWVSPTQSSNLPQISCYSNRRALTCEDGRGFGFILGRDGTFRKR